MPQPKKYASNAAKQRAYRGRQKAKLSEPEPPTTDDPADWERYLKAVGLGANRASTLAGQRFDHLTCDIPDDRLPES